MSCFLSTIFGIENLIEIVEYFYDELFQEKVFVFGKFYVKAIFTMDGKLLDFLLRLQRIFVSNF